MKFCIFPENEIGKFDNFNLTSFFLSKHSFLSYKCDEKILSNHNRIKVEFFLKEFKFSIVFLGKTGHFWTWKLENLESRHQNCQLHSILTLGNDGFLSLLILTYRALKLIFLYRLLELI